MYLFHISHQFGNQPQACSTNLLANDLVKFLIGWRLQCPACNVIAVARAMAPTPSPSSPKLAHGWCFTRLFTFQWMFSFPDFILLVCQDGGLKIVMILIKIQNRNVIPTLSTVCRF
jgi:hypothetical protein